MQLELNNIFCASNPSKVLDALWTLVNRDGNDFSDNLIFVPSRRAARSVEKFFVQKNGDAVILPRLVVLGEDAQDSDAVSDDERLIILSKILSGDAGIRGFANALPLAAELIRLQDKMDECDIHKFDFGIDEKHAKHFQKKSEILNIITTAFEGQTTRIKQRDKNIRNGKQNMECFGRVIILCPNLTIPSVVDLCENVARTPSGAVLLQGLYTNAPDSECNPYYPTQKFLKRIAAEDINIIDVGQSNIGFLNDAFSNTVHNSQFTIHGVHRIDCARENEEANIVAEIASRAIAENKSVLVITPDTAGNQRLSAAFRAKNINADFSGGVPGSMTTIGRAILNYLDENPSDINNIVNIIENNRDQMAPWFEFDDTALEIVVAIQNANDIVSRNGIKLSPSDARALIADVLSRVSVRPPLDDDALVRVLGVIESRVQTADVVILTGLNDGMFPKPGYSNPWVPRGIADKMGLLSPDVAVSLSALDFITLSCNAEVYWTRSKTAGGSQTTESRFLSRLMVKGLRFGETSISHQSSTINHQPLDYSAPTPPADRSDVFVTDLELLIHNPFAYYAKHILKLRPRDDWWCEPDVRDFGNIVHKVIEECAKSKVQSTDSIIDKLDIMAKEILPKDSVVFHFWHKRFVEIAPEISRLASITDTQSEIELETIIAGRRVRARADMIFNNTVLDIKTGTVPSKKQLMLGNMPQLPLEAYMMQSSAVMQFLQLKNNNIKLIEYNGDDAANMITNTVQKVYELFGRYSCDFEPYEYYETADKKYQAFDDLARNDSE